MIGVIGGSGLVGQALMTTLKKEGSLVIGTYLTNHLSGLVPLDIREPAAVHAYFSAFKPKTIFLTAAMVWADYCETHPDEAFRVNVRGAENVVREASRTGCQLVYYSTDYIFDGKNGPYTEEDTPFPLSVYGRRKLMAERIIQDMLKDYLIIRTTAVYGWYTQKNFVTQLWQRLQSGEEVSVPNDQIGNPTLADYLAETSIELAYRGVQGIVNVVGKDLMSRSEFAIQLAESWGFDPYRIRPISTFKLGQVAPRPLNGGLKTDKLTKLLGESPLSLRKSLIRLNTSYQDSL